MLRNRLAKLEKRNDGFEVPPDVMLAMALADDRFEMWGKECTREELAAVARRYGPLIIVDL